MAVPRPILGVVVALPEGRQLGVPVSRGVVALQVRPGPGASLAHSTHRNLGADGELNDEQLEEAPHHADHDEDDVIDQVDGEEV